MNRIAPIVAALAAALTLLMSGAASASPPSVVTGAATDVKLSSAVVRGWVNPNGETTTYEVEYGKTTSYGLVTGVVNIGSGGEKEVSEELFGLLPETTYHYRIVAKNKSGTTEGADKTLTTMRWQIEGQTLPELGIEGESFESTGSFTLEIPSIGFALHCDESGAGEISGVAELSMTDCSIEGAEKTCSVEPFEIELNHFVSSSFVMVTTGPFCTWFEEEEWTAIGFVVESAPEAVALEMQLLGEGHFASVPMSLSIASTWTLSGEHGGQAFGIF